MPRRDRRSASEVDLTPLIDVLFNLIIFLVLAASFDRGLVTVDLPRGETADAAGTSPLTIQVLPEGELRIEGGPATPGEAVRRAREAVRALWDALRPGGRELMPLDRYDFSELYGWVNDRFGVSWQINAA
jgi:biopolymer transport protein ExbD